MNLEIIQSKSEILAVDMFVYSSIHVYINYIHIYNTVVGTFEPISA